MDRFSSEDFEAERFVAHGGSQFFWNGALWISQITGNFNLEGVLANNRSRQALFAKYPPEAPYVYLTLCQGGILATPEALSAHLEGLQSVFLNNYRAPTAVAWVATGVVEGFDLMGSLYVKNFAAVGIPMRLFKDRQKAEVWLASTLNRPGTMEPT